MKPKNLWMVGRESGGKLYAVFFFYRDAVAFVGALPHVERGLYYIDRLGLQGRSPEEVA